MFLCALPSLFYAACLDRDYYYLLLCLFQLKISLNKEAPQLGLGTGYHVHKQFGTSTSGITGMSDRLFHRAYADKLHVLPEYKRSIFNSNLQRALRAALGHSSLVQTDPISLSGYNFDFEVLLDSGDQPIHIPMKWKYKSAGILLASVGAGKREKPKQVKMKLSDDFMQAMKEVVRVIVCFRSKFVEISEVIYF